MAMSRQQRAERSAQVHALGLKGSEAMDGVIKSFRCMGERQLAAALSVELIHWRQAIARRCNDLDRPAVQVREVRDAG